MAISQNGWSANDKSVIETYTVGKGIKVALRKGDAGFLLKHYADWFDANIRDIDNNYKNGELDDWGYAERPIRGATQLSNHASGTAIDLNATQWALGSEPSVYLTAAEIAKVRQQLKLYEGVLRWGGDYTGRKDPMHVEINANATAVARVAEKIRNSATPITSQNGGLHEMILIRNTKGAVALLGGSFVEWVPTATDMAGLQKAGVPLVQCSDDFFNRLTAAANRGDSINDLTR